MPTTVGVLLCAGHGLPRCMAAASTAMDQSGFATTCLTAGRGNRTCLPASLDCERSREGCPPGRCGCRPAVDTRVQAGGAKANEKKGKEPGGRFFRDPPVSKRKIEEGDQSGRGWWTGRMRGWLVGGGRTQCSKKKSIPRWFRGQWSHRRSSDRGRLESRPVSRLETMDDDAAATAATWIIDT